MGDLLKIREITIQVMGMFEQEGLAQLSVAMIVYPQEIVEFLTSMKVYKFNTVENSMNSSLRSAHQPVCSLVL